MFYPLPLALYCVTHYVFFFVFNFPNGDVLSPQVDYDSLEHSNIVFLSLVTLFLE